MPSRKFVIQIFFLSASVFYFTVFYAVCRADLPGISVTPAVVDEKVKTRDILKKNLTITNSSREQLDLYPIVNNINAAEGRLDFVPAGNADERSASLADWIEISRASIEIKPGETKTVPFMIRVHMDAKPGSYHAQISFGAGTTRAEAEQSPNKAVININVEVLEDVKEVLQLKKFSSDSIFFSGDDVVFSYILENIGNKELFPTGEIRIYNRKGEEVAAVEANREKRTFGPDKSMQFASVWNGAQGFGRYKAFLNLNYGSKGSVQDTVFFWIVPIKTLGMIFAFGLLGVLISASVFHRWLERRQMVLAGAGDDFGGGARRFPPKPPVQKENRVFSSVKKDDGVLAKNSNSAAFSEPRSPVYHAKTVLDKPLVAPAIRRQTQGLPCSSEKSEAERDIRNRKQDSKNKKRFWFFSRKGSEYVERRASTEDFSKVARPALRERGDGRGRREVVRPAVKDMSVRKPVLLSDREKSVNHYREGNAFRGKFVRNRIDETERDYFDESARREARLAELRERIYGQPKIYREENRQGRLAEESDYEEDYGYRKTAGREFVKRWPDDLRELKDYNGDGVINLKDVSFKKEDDYESYINEGHIIDLR